MANNKIQTAVQNNKPEAKAQQSINTMLAGLLDGQKMRARFDEILGKRAPQFISSLVTMINGSADLQQAFYSDPMSIITAALRAATYDLPVDPALGYAYIVPFNNTIKNPDGSKTKKKSATFIIGYKGMTQLALRTGAYSRIPDAVDVRQGELVRYDRLTGDMEFKWIEDDEEREKLPIIGYAGYFRLKNGAEKTIYMSVKQIDAHEKRNRKGEFMGKGWREDWDSMARKTVIRKLLSKYGLMSIEYQDGTDKATLDMANAVAEQEFPEEADIVIDTSTGEVTEPTLLDEGEEPLEYPDFLKEDMNDAINA
jgi:recombination protein RecT